MASIKRKFGKRRFTNVATVSTKKEAKSRKAAWKAQGRRVRVIKVKGGFDIFVNP